MTSVVRVTAHCAAEKEVVVRVLNLFTNDVLEEQVLQDGETVEKYIHAERAVLSFERERYIDDLSAAGE